MPGEHEAGIPVQRDVAVGIADWGVALHDRDLARAIIDRIQERGRYVPLKGPSIDTMRTRHLEGLDYES